MTYKASEAPLSNAVHGVSDINITFADQRRWQCACNSYKTYYVDSIKIDIIDYLNNNISRENS